MTQYFCGKGGNDGNDGTTWALRKLTLSGVAGLDTISISAGDELIVGPGVYREVFISDGVGSSGSEIILRGDPTGKDTDGVGGQVIFSGSDDDQTSIRGEGIAPLVGKDFWIIRNLHFELYNQVCIKVGASASDWTVEDCTFLLNGGPVNFAVQAQHLDGGYEIRRCIFVGFNSGSNLRFMPASEQSYGTIVENCLFIGGGDGIYIERAVDITVQNCTFYQQNDDGIDVNAATTGSIDVNNCIFVGIDNNALEAVAFGDLIEDYNTFANNSSDRALVDTGANSETYPPIFDLPILMDGYMMPFTQLGMLSERSTLQLAGSSETSEDIFGIVKPTVAAKSSWGAFQQKVKERETTTTYGSSTASIKLPDAGEVMFFVPVDGSEVTISVQAQREANYAGTLPTMIVRQPGQSDRVTTDTGAVSQWNELTDTFTPGSGDYVVVILRSLNTATSGSYGTFFDALTVE